jgi:hypothetical protein
MDLQGTDDANGIVRVDPGSGFLVKGPQAPVHFLFPLAPDRLFQAKPNARVRGKVCR